MESTWGNTMSFKPYLYSLACGPKGPSVCYLPNTKSIMFDGVDDYLGVDVDDLNLISNYVGMALKFKTTSTSLGVMAGIGQDGGSGTTDGDNLYFAVTDTGVVRVNVVSTNSSNTLESSARIDSDTGGYNDGAWHSAVFLWNRSSDATPGFRLWVDGVKMTGGTNNMGSYNCNITNMYLGCQLFDSGRYAFFDGEIDEPFYFGDVHVDDAEVEYFHTLKQLCYDDLDVAVKNKVLFNYRNGDGAGDSTASGGTIYDQDINEDSIVYNASANNMVTGSIVEDAP